jgi:indolepyruvate ferredoxin oxidoreductase, beta subunit
MDETKNVIMVGVGGQGIILASELLSEAALLAGYDIRKSEVHGMAQRGGSVSSHVRFGKRVLSPLIEMGRADIMLAFEKVEGLRECRYLKRGGTIIMNDMEVIPTTVSLGVCTYPRDVPERLGGLGFEVALVDAQEIAKRAGTVKAANVVLLAALASFLDIGKDIWTEVIGRRVPKKFLDVNLEAFRLGYGGA